MHQKYELVFFNPRKLEGFLIQNHHVPQNLFILTRKSTSSGENSNHSIKGLFFCFLQKHLHKGNEIVLGFAVGNVAFGADFAAYAVKHGSFALGPK